MTPADPTPPPPPWSSREAERFGFKLLNAMRNQFGGHESRRKVKPLEREGA